VCSPCSRPVLSLAVAEIGAAQQMTPPESLRPSVMAAVATTAQAPPHDAELRTSRRWTKALAGVAVAAAVVGAFALGGVIGQPDGPEQIAEDQAQSMLTAPDAKMMPMVMADGAHSSVVVSRAEGRALLMVDDMAMPTDDDVYQLWLIDSNDTTHEMETFRPNADGQVAMMMVGDFDDAVTLEITMESAGGSRSPTSPPIGIAQLA